MVVYRQILGLCAWALVLALLSSCRAPMPTFPHEDALYLWQRAWTDDVRHALQEAPNHADHLMVLTVEAETAPIAVDWTALADTNLPLTFVLRYPRLSASKAHFQQVLGDLAQTIDSASQSGIPAAGVQLDFDSATRLLPDYTALVQALRPELPEGLALSVTALPTWLESPDFTDLVAHLDYYVLQVHSFERPDSIDTPLVLCDTSRIPAYLEKASAAGTPYYVAFPTHGYQVAYTPEGAFAGLIAEEADALRYPAGYQTREVRADPAAIAKAAAQLQAAPPPGYRGNVWFRMPVATDTRNWTWPTLAAVMQGRTPTVRHRVEIRYPDPGLAEIWLHADGEDTAPVPVTLDVTFPINTLIAADCVNGFTAAQPKENGKSTLRGRAPTAKEALLVAWYRMQDEESAQRLTAQLSEDPS